MSNIYYILVTKRKATMRTNMSFPTISPGLFQDPRFSERMPVFAREAHQLKLTLKPIPRTTEHRSEFVN